MSVRYPTLWKYTAREMQRRPGRAFLTLLGIVLGVAAVVSISVTTASTEHAYREMFESVAGRAGLEVVAQGLGAFDGTIAKRLESIEGVKAAIPMVRTPAVLLGTSGGTGVLVVGLDPNAKEATSDYTIQEGRGLGAADEVLLPAPFAKAQKIDLGGNARILTPVFRLSGPVIAALPVVGFLEAQGAASFNGGAVVCMPLATAQRLFAMEHRVNCVQITLAEGADPRQVEARLRDRLPTGLTVQMPAARGELAEATLLSTELGLSSLSFVSLVVGGFVILNSFLMNLGERRRNLAVLRALGATRSQVRRLLLREAAFLGFAGTVFGLGLGLVFSVALHRVMEGLMGVTLPPQHWTLSPFLYALLLGPGMALAATWVPAQRAARRAPLEDLLQKHLLGREVFRRWPVYLGFGLLAAMLAIALGLLRGWFSPAVAALLLAPGIGMGLVGCVLAIPLVLAPLMRFAAFVLQPLLGTEGRLAFRYLERHPTRTALTVGILFIGIAVSISFGQSLRNNIRDIRRWYEQNLNVDYIIRGVMPDTTALITPAPLPERLADEIAGIEGVEHVGKVSFIPIRAQGRQVGALPITVDPQRPLPFALATGDAGQARQGLQDGEVVLGTALAQRLGLKAGDSLELETRQGVKSVRIAGTTSEYTTGGMMLYLEWNTGKRLFEVAAVHAFTVVAQSGSGPEVGERLKAYCGEHGLQFQSVADLRGLVEQAMGGIVALFWGLVVLVFIVASLGVVNTLTMNVLEQTRELGVLRAIAMKRGQIGKMIVAQALALGVISLLPGIIVGIGLAYLMNLGTHPLIGQMVAFHLDIAFVCGCFVVALTIAVLAALVPAHRAVRLPVIQALQYE
jgi:putative ABC transport system permease protein